MFPHGGAAAYKTAIVLTQNGGGVRRYVFTVRQVGCRLGIEVRGDRRDVA